MAKECTVLGAALHGKRVHGAGYSPAWQKSARCWVQPCMAKECTVLGAALHGKKCTVQPCAAKECTVLGAALHGKRVHGAGCGWLRVAWEHALSSERSSSVSTP